MALLVDILFIYFLGKGTSSRTAMTAEGKVVCVPCVQLLPTMTVSWSLDSKKISRGLLGGYSRIYKYPNFPGCRLVADNPINKNNWLYNSDCISNHSCHQVRRYCHDPSQETEGTLDHFSSRLWKNRDFDSPGLIFWLWGREMASNGMSEQCWDFYRSAANHKPREVSWETKVMPQFRVKDTAYLGAWIGFISQCFLSSWNFGVFKEIWKILIPDSTTPSH